VGHFKRLTGGRHIAERPLLREPTVLAYVSSSAASALARSPIRIRNSAFASIALQISDSPSLSSAVLIASLSRASSVALAASSFASRAASASQPSASQVAR